MHLTKLASIQLTIWKMIEKYHLDPEPIFTKVLLDPALMHRPGARYPLIKIRALWDEMGRKIKDPCVGLTAATCWHPSYFGTLGYAMLVSTSLRITLERLIRFHKAISDSKFAELHENQEKGTLVFSLTNKDEGPYSYAREDAALAWIMSVLRVNFPKDLAPESVKLTHGKPDCAGKYYEFFQAPVAFDSDVCSFELSLDVVDQVLPGENKELADFNDQIMTKYITALDQKTLLSKVKKSIVEHLPSGDANIKNVASDLFVSPRTLQRLLQEEETTFIALLNETRKDIAMQYIQDNDMDLIEIAFLLGFAEQSTFSRSFKRWTGKSPTQYKKAV